MDNATRSKLLRARTTTTMMMLSRVLEEKCGRWNISYCVIKRRRRKRRGMG
jgi:hypothetical protein